MTDPRVLRTGRARSPWPRSVRNYWQRVKQAAAALWDDPCDGPGAEGSAT